MILKQKVFVDDAEYGRMVLQVFCSVLAGGRELTPELALQTVKLLDDIGFAQLPDVQKPRLAKVLEEVRTQPSEVGQAAVLPEPPAPPAA